MAWAFLQGAAKWFHALQSERASKDQLDFDKKNLLARLKFLRSSIAKTQEEKEERADKLTQLTSELSWKKLCLAAHRDI